jgi:hypothetical protein
LETSGSEGFVTGILEDATGLDGCKWLIRLSETERLHPVSFPKGFVPLGGQTVNFTYEGVDVMTTCMAGRTVKVQSINYPEQRVIHDTVNFEGSIEESQTLPFVLLASETRPGIVILRVQYSGCYPLERVGVKASMIETKSLPPQRPMMVEANAGDCEMLVEQTWILDVSGLAYPTVLTFNTQEGAKQVLAEPNHAKKPE